MRLTFIRIEILRFPLTLPSSPDLSSGIEWPRRSALIFTLPAPPHLCLVFTKMSKTAKNTPYGVGKIPKNTVSAGFIQGHLSLRFVSTKDPTVDSPGLGCNTV